MPIFEYECPAGHRTEVLDLARRYVDVRTIPCAKGDPPCELIAERVISSTNWQYGDGPKESNISAAIKRVKRAEAEGKIR
jgi:hypothetical protein